MPENMEQEDQEVELENQPEETVAEETPAQPDYSALQEKISGLGIDGVTLDNIVDRFKETHTLTRNLQNNNADLKREIEAVEQFKPLLGLVKSDPGLERALHDRALEYLRRDGQYAPDGEDQNAQEIVHRMLDPVARQIHEHGRQLAEYRLRENLGKLQSEYGDFVTQEVKDQVVRDCLASGNMDDVDGAFWRRYGKTLVANAGKNAKAQTVKNIQERNQTGGSILSTEAMPRQVPADDRPADVDSAEFDAYLDKKIDYFAKNQKEADKVVGRLLNI